MENVEKTILSQYANSPCIRTIIESYNQSLDPSRFITDWYNLVWSLDTAQGYGLDVWGRIVGISRIIKLSPDLFLGFDEANDVTEEAWNQAPFYAGASATTNYRATDNFYRKLIRIKAMANLTDFSILSLNEIIMTLADGEGDAWVQDNGDMTMTYMLNFTPTTEQLGLIQGLGGLPAPSGVSASYKIQDSTA
ncbi:DUF2612 domain-containing protein [Acetobacter thailandicus]|uniref:DUF2612 domain-containing protein n=1 Tax=Acetobacter thailandicus TaxID=1502842 RepID=UPI001BA9A10A|nr:DUF2612 domain-containing protein [Acetobacter thailandicus]MBS0959771.1 DUF2612 domain-containing protein [Acetobacter thailandicus]